jgi:hypothetical protein
MAAVTTTMPAATVAAATRVLHRRTNFHVELCLVLQFVGLERDQIHKHIVEREHLGLGHHGSDEGIIGGRKTCAKISNNLFISKRGVNRDELSGEACDLEKEVCSR